MFCMSLLSAYPPGANIVRSRFRCENTSSCSLSKSFFVGIFIWRGAIRCSFLRGAPHLIDWHRESQSERFHQHAPQSLGKKGAALQIHSWGGGRGTGTSLGHPSWLHGEQTFLPRGPPFQRHRERRDSPRPDRHSLLFGMRPRISVGRSHRSLMDVSLLRTRLAAVSPITKTELRTWQGVYRAPHGRFTSSRSESVG